jgi:hypothetical protein
VRDRHCGNCNGTGHKVYACQIIVETSGGEGVLRNLLFRMTQVPCAEVLILGSYSYKINRSQEEARYML